MEVNSALLSFRSNEGGNQEGSINGYPTFVAHGDSLLHQQLYDRDRSNEMRVADLLTDNSQHNWENYDQVSHQILSQYLNNPQVESESVHSKNNSIVLPHPNHWKNRKKDPGSSKSQSDFSAFYHQMNDNISKESKAEEQKSEVKEVQYVLEPHSESKMEQIVGEKQSVIQLPEAKSRSQLFPPFKVDISIIPMQLSQSQSEEQKINIDGPIEEKKNMERDYQPQPEGKEEKQQFEKAEGKEKKQQLMEEEGEKEEKQEVKPASSKEKLFQRYWGIIRQKLAEDKNITVERVEMYQRLLRKSQNQPQLDRALGAIYGALIGDALGAYCSSLSSLPDQMVDEAMQMNGGGIFGLAVGQFTDDSELAAHLLQGLSYFQQLTPLEDQKARLVCRLGLQYMRWYKSGPFDYGKTIRLSVEAMCQYEEQLRKYAQGKKGWGWGRSWGWGWGWGWGWSWKKQPKFLEKMLGEISNRNKNSMASGSLMRISPFAFFFSLSGINPRLHAQFIKDEIRLTHPNETLAAAGVFWVNLLTTLIKRPDNSKETFCTIFNSTKTAHPTFQKQLQPWFDEAMKLKQQAMSAINMGFAKIPFSYGLRILNYLAQGLETKVDAGLYQEWMRWIIKRAGATDTNGAIGGGLMGSIVGFWGLPEQYVVRTLKTVTDHRLFKIVDEEEQPQHPNKYSISKRASFYEPCNVLLAALDLMPRLQRYRDNFSQQE